MGLLSKITGAVSDLTGGMIGGDELSGLGGLVSAGAGLFGGMSTNSSNRDIAEANNAWSASQYATRYRTTVKDMEAAGLNPMLAYTQGAGSAPTGSTIPMQNPVSGTVDSALAHANLAKVRADTAVSTANAAKVASEVPKAEVKGSVWKKVQSLIEPVTNSAMNGKESDENVKKLKELYPDSFDDRAPFHKFIDNVGEWNPFGL